MPLKAGQSLLHYRLVDKLGEGGMGVVWRARDPNLDRDVAIKVLPAAMAEDRERITRFQREAKLLASLSHPNIAAVYGFDTADDVRFLVMEYVEGETLADRLKRGAMQVDEALDVARQVAEALEVAHGSGVIHRDLKPGNVMFRPDGTVKVLDFGLAKELPGTSSSTSESMSPTFTADFTVPGIVLGTAAYMSPEQARGRSVDKRADIWSFGVILFECLTGERLFAGDSAHDSMGAILHKEPDWSRLPPNTPPTIQLLLRRCLTKPRKRRLHDIADARVEIDAAIDDPTSSSLGLAAQVVAEVERAPTRRLGLIGLVAGIVIGALAVGGYWMFRTPPVEEKAIRRFEFAQGLQPRHVAISSDGRAVAFATEDTVYVRDLNAVESRSLWTAPQKKQVGGLAWSPDGASLAVYADNTLWRIAVASGQAIELTVKPAAYLAGWPEDGFLWLHSWSDGSTYRVPARGGSAQPTIERAEGELHLHGLSSLPGGRGVLLASHSMEDEVQAIVLLTPDGERRVLHESDVDLGGPVYSSTGHILYGRSGRPDGIWALPFSLDDLKVTGEPFLVHSGSISFSVSDAGDLVFLARDPVSDEERRPVWVTRMGEVESEIDVTLFDGYGPALSNDGRRLAVSATGLDGSESETDRDIWVVDLDRALATRLAAEKGYQMDPQWSPDDGQVIYINAKSFDNIQVVRRAADGSGTAETLAEESFGISTVDDGQTTAITRGSLTEKMWIEVGRLDDPTSWREFQNGDESDFGAIVRPGGGLVAYLSGSIMSEEQALFLRRFPEGEGRWPISRHCTGRFRWSHTGDRLYFVERDGENKTLMEVPVDLTGDRVELGDATPLFSMSDHRFNGFDVAPDGERFITLQGPEETDDGEPAEDGIVIVENWAEEFRGADGR